MSQTIGIDIKVNSQGAEKEINGMEAALNKMGKAALGLVALDKLKDIGIYAAKTADEFTALEGRLADTMQGFGSLENAMESIKRISSETGAGIQTVGKLFENVAESAKNAGKSSADAEKLVETLSRIKSAYNIEDTGFSSAMLQFNQALSTGILRGEEFNGVFEGASPIIRAMAQALDVNVGHMRKLAENGVLTTEKIFSLSEQLPKIIEKMEKAPKTIGTEWGKLVSEFDQSFISLNNNYGITEKIASLMGWTAGKIKNIREGADGSFIKMPRKREAVEKDLLSKHHYWSEDVKNKDIDAVMQKEKDDFEKQKSSGGADFNLFVQEKEQARENERIAAEERKRQEENAARLLKEAEDKAKNTPEARAKEAKKRHEEMLRDEEALMSDVQKKDEFELQMKAEKYAKERQLLTEHKEAQLEIESRYGGLMREGEEIKNDSIDGMDEQTKKKHMSRLKDYGLKTLNEAGNYSKKMFEISKAANLADAVIFGYTSVQRALRDFPVPYNFAIAGLVAAQAAVQVRGIRAQKYGGGGGSFTPATGGGGASSQGFGAISEKFSDKSDSKPQKQVNITIADGDIFSAKSVRELIKKIGEEVGNNLVLTTG